MKLLRATLASLPLLLLAGCPQPPAPACDGGAVVDGGCAHPPAACDGGYGDPSQPAQIELIAITEEKSVADVGACGTLDIVVPPQGGFVVLVGVRVTNVNACGAQLSVNLSEPSTRYSFGFDIRKLKLAPIAGRPGWAETLGAGDAVNGIPNFANVALCNNNDPYDLHDGDRLLTATLTEQSGRVSTASVHVVPRCQQAATADWENCECSCSKGSGIASCVSLDGGWDAGAPVQCDPDGGLVDGGT